MNVYAGIFLISLTTLVYEITLTRLLSVITWYHLTFLAVSTAMLGMTAGATTVYLKPHWFTQDRLNNSVAKACLLYSMVIPISLTLLCLTPLYFTRSIMSYFAFIAATVECTLPFYFSGIAITAILTKHRFSIGKLYASDLIGASLGCLVVLGGLEILDAPSLILLSGTVAILAAFSFAWKDRSFKFGWVSWCCLGVLAVLIAVNSVTPYGIRPFFVKGRIEKIGDYCFEKWNSFSRISVSDVSAEGPRYWGPSPLTPEEKSLAYMMNIDGCAGTSLRKFSSIDDIKNLRFDVVNIGYYLRPSGGACIIGVGGGKDIQSAILFGHKKITGIDVNPIFIDLLEGRFKEFAGIAGREGVDLIVDEARSFLSRTKEKYSFIQMSLIDTWAATGAGAFSLSENALYTVEAWKLLLDRLTDNGIFTVSRWYSSRNLGETGRVISLAVAALLETGDKSPSWNIAMVTSGNISTLLLSKRPFSTEDISKLKEISSSLRFDLVVIPGTPPENEILRSIISAGSISELRTIVARWPMNYTPTTDENPYFFNMLRLGWIRPDLWADPGMIRGNMLAGLTLLILILSLSLLTIVTIVIPLKLKARSETEDKRENVLWPGAVYFSLIGAGFMFAEIALIQRLSVFLGHPVYALGILLFSMIASAGIGSFLSERLPLIRVPWVFLYPAMIALAIIAVRFALPVLGRDMVSASMMIKIAASILVITPLGMLLGVCFPTGMRLIGSREDSETPWYWALNGIFSVLSSALAVFISIYFSISTSFYIASICYLLLLICLPPMYIGSKKLQDGAFNKS